MPQTYSTSQIVLHWTIAALVAVQFLLAENMAEAFERMEAGFESGEAAAGRLGSAISAGAALHMGTGAAILGLTVWRLGLRWRRGAPPAPGSDPLWQKRLSRAVHAALYGLLLALPVAGATAWFGRSEAAAEVHETFGVILLGLVGLHIAGALYGQFVQRTGVLTRMLRPGG